MLACENLSKVNTLLKIIIGRNKMKKSDKKIKRKIVAIAVLGIFAALMLAQPVAADGDHWHHDGDNLGGEQDLGTTSTHDLPIITDGTERMRIKAGGNIGIGTESPDQLLQLGGSDKSITGIMRFEASDGDWVDLGITTSDEFYITGGNVGIGTTDPNQKLEVLATSTQLRLAYDANNYAEFSVDGNGLLTIQSTGSDEDIKIKTTSFDNAIYIDDSLGRVGIGTASPGSKLEIKSGGVAGATSALHVTDSISTSLLFVRDDGNIGIGVIDPEEKLEIDGNVRFNTGANREIHVETAPDNTDGYDLTIKAGNGKYLSGMAGHLGGHLYLRGGDADGPVLGDGGDVYLYGGVPTLLDGNDGDVILAYTGSAVRGKVGIGTASPVGTLDVDGSLYVGNEGIYDRDDAVVNVKEDLEVAGDASADRFVARTGAGDVEFADEDGTDGVKISNSDTNPNILIGDYSVTSQNFRGIYLDGALQTTSIGTVDSSSRLVVASIDDEDDALRLLGPDGGTTAWGARLNFGDDEDAYIEEDADDKLYIYADSRIALMGSFVGIGQTIPLAKLEVLEDTGNPQLRLTYENQVKFVDFKVESDADLLIKPSVSGQIKLQPSTDSQGFFQVLDRDGGDPILNVDAIDERVGIGTSSPTGALDVNGNDIRIRSSQTHAISTDYGYTGEICWDSSYIYVCTNGDGVGGSTDTWERVAISTW
jgi:hypothetical protein